MSNKSYGITYERTEKHFWQGMGFEVSRCRGSFGLFDMIVVNSNMWRLVSVKSTKQKNYSFKKEIKEIDKFNNAPVGTAKLLVLYHKGKRKLLYEKIINDLLPK